MSNVLKVRNREWPDFTRIMIDQGGVRWVNEDDAFDALEAKEAEIKELEEALIQESMRMSTKQVVAILHDTGLPVSHQQLCDLVDKAKAERDESRAECERLREDAEEHMDVDYFGKQLKAERIHFAKARADLMQELKRSMEALELTEKYLPASGMQFTREQIGSIVTTLKRWESK